MATAKVGYCVTSGASSPWEQVHIALLRQTPCIHRSIILAGVPTPCSVQTARKHQPPHRRNMHVGRLRHSASASNWQRLPYTNYQRNCTLLEVCGSTRTRGYGSGTGTKSTGRVYPFLPVKNAIFHDVRAIAYRMFLFFLFSERRRPSVSLSSVCLSSVTFVKFSAVFLRHLMAIPWHAGKIWQRSSQGNLSVGGVKDKRGNRI